jgi:hypothetical protein
MIKPKIAGMLVAAFVAGSFVASPELRAYAANTVFSTDIVDGEVKTADLGSNSVTAAKIKDAEVKAAEIATDAVGAAELQGVSKLLFGQCTLSSAEAGSKVNGGGDYAVIVNCTINGVDSDDTALATLNGGGGCFDVSQVFTSSNNVQVNLRNGCTFNTSPGAASLSVVVFDK